MLTKSIVICRVVGADTLTAAHSVWPAVLAAVEGAHSQREDKFDEEKKE